MKNYKKPNINKTGYEMMQLCKNGKRKNYLIHRLVMNAFCPSTNTKLEINHKDGNKLNNCVDNLEWVTHSDNVKYSFEKLGRKGYSANSKFKGEKHWKSKVVLQLDLDNNIIKRWENIRQVGDELGLDTGSISKCCNNKRKTVGNYKWMFE